MSAQLTRADLAGMTPDQINDARQDGRLDTLLGVPSEDVAVLDKARSEEHLTRADLAHLTRLGRADLIDAAHRDERVTLDTAEKD